MHIVYTGRNYMTLFVDMYMYNIVVVAKAIGTQYNKPLNKEHSSKITNNWFPIHVVPIHVVIIHFEPQRRGQPL